jgi:hypothetical protein
MVGLFFIKRYWHFFLIAGMGIAVLSLATRIQEASVEKTKWREAYEHQAVELKSAKTSLRSLTEKLHTIETRKPDGTVVIETVKETVSNERTTEKNSNDTKPVLPSTTLRDYPLVALVNYKFSDKSIGGGLAYEALSIRIPLVRADAKVAIGGMCNDLQKVSGWGGVVLLRFSPR